MLTSPLTLSFPDPRILGLLREVQTRYILEIFQDAKIVAEVRFLSLPPPSKKTSNSKP